MTKILSFWNRTLKTSDRRRKYANENTLMKLIIKILINLRFNKSFKIGHLRRETLVIKN